MHSVSRVAEYLHSVIDSLTYGDKIELIKNLASTTGKETTLTLACLHTSLPSH